MNILEQIGTDVKNHVQDHKGKIKIVDTESNITSRSSDDAGTMALGSDTEDLYIHMGSGNWVKLETVSA
jgi:hypothetical protein